jgi:hypothetical protein
MRLDVEVFDTQRQVRDFIQRCEGQHTQQVAYSTFHDSLTQICFGCQKVRTNMKVKLC